jgi:hypothetical protein
MRQDMIRTAVLAALTAAAIALTAAPVFAGPAELAFLQKLNASWVGKGRVSGPNGGPVACRIEFTANGQAARYQGRCTIPDMAAQAFNGAITYNDKLKRYEARSVNGSVPGTKRGNALIFTNKTVDVRGSAYSTMTVSPTSLVVKFSFVDPQGQKSGSTITFSK